MSLDVEAGEFVCFLGPSGCGKTTLLRAIAGLDRQDAGRIFIGGRDVSNLPPAARDFGIVFQSYALFPNLTVAENIGFGLVNRKSDPAAVKRRVTELLETIGLPEQAVKYPVQLSGGQQQRVAVARALVPRPDLIFADEPTGALDSRTGIEILTFMRSAVDESGQTIVMVTHDPHAASYADNVLFLADGQIIDEMASPTTDRVLDRMKQFEG